MSIDVEATYEDGVLKLDRPLPLAEHERLIVRIISQPSLAAESYGLIGWTGDPEVVRHIAENDEFDALESP